MLRYKELYGNFHPPNNFVIPWNDDWPEELWGHGLGERSIYLPIPVYTYPPTYVHTYLPTSSVLCTLWHPITLPTVPISPYYTPYCTNTILFIIVPYFTPSDTPFYTPCSPHVTPICYPSPVRWHCQCYSYRKILPQKERRTASHGVQLSGRGVPDVIARYFINVYLLSRSSLFHPYLPNPLPCFFNPTFSTHLLHSPSPPTFSTHPLHPPYQPTLSTPYFQAHLLPKYEREYEYPIVRAALSRYHELHGHIRPKSNDVCDGEDYAEGTYSIT